MGIDQLLVLIGLELKIGRLGGVVSEEILRGDLEWSIGRVSPGGIDGALGRTARLHDAGLRAEPG